MGKWNCRQRPRGRSLLDVFRRQEAHVLSGMIKVREVTRVWMVIDSTFFFSGVLTLFQVLSSHLPPACQGCTPSSLCIKTSPPAPRTHTSMWHSLGFGVASWMIPLALGSYFISGSKSHSVPSLKLIYELQRTWLYLGAERASRAEMGIFCY